MMENKSALATQVGGDHYKKGMQPVELFAKLHLNAFQANVIKYVVRYKHKNGIEDLKKAKHYADLAVEVKPYPYSFSETLPVFYVKNSLDMFYDGKDLNEAERHIIYSVIFDGYFLTSQRLSDLIKELEEENNAN